MKKNPDWLLKTNLYNYTQSQIHSVDCLIPVKIEIVDYKEKEEDSWLQEHQQQEKIVFREELRMSESQRKNKEVGATWLCAHLISQSKTVLFHGCWHFL